MYLTVTNQEFLFEDRVTAEGRRWIENNPLDSKTYNVSFHNEKQVGSAFATKFCHQDFVLKYVVIGGKKDFQVESGLFRDLFWSRSGCFIAICTKMRNCLELLGNARIFTAFITATPP